MNEKNNLTQYDDKYYESFIESNIFIKKEDLLNLLSDDIIRNLNLYYRVKTAPIMNISKKSNGTVDIFLQQTDKNATGIKIYRTIFKI